MLIARVLIFSCNSRCNSRPFLNIIEIKQFQFTSKHKENNNISCALSRFKITVKINFFTMSTEVAPSHFVYGLFNGYIINFLKVS